MNISVLQTSLKGLRGEVKLQTHLRSSLDRSISGLVPPNAELFLIWTPEGKLTEKALLLALASWGMNSELRCLVQLDLMDFVFRRLQEDDKLALELCLSSFKAAQEVISKRYSERDWFGNALPLLKKVLNSIHFQWRLPRRPRKKIYRRGYQDHGSLRPLDRWLPCSDYSLTQLQNQLEEQRNIYQNTLDFMRGFLE